MKVEVRKMDDLILLPVNPRHGDVGAISESLGRFDQVKPIVINAENVIIDGNHTYMAAVAQGFDEVHVIVTDLPPEEQRAYALAANRTGDLATMDHDILLAELKTLHDLDQLAGTGYDVSDIDDLIALDEETGFDLDGGDKIDTLADRREAGDWYSATGAVRSVVLILNPDQHAWFSDAIGQVAGETNTERFLNLLAWHTDTEVPE